MRLQFSVNVDDSFGNRGVLLREERYPDCAVRNSQLESNGLIQLIAYSECHSELAGALPDMRDVVSRSP